LVGEDFADAGLTTYLLAALFFFLSAQRFFIKSDKRFLPAALKRLPPLLRTAVRGRDAPLE